MDRAAAQQWVDEFLTGEPQDGAQLAAAAPEVPGLRRPFSPFVPSDVQRSAELQGELHDKAADAKTPEDVIGAVSAHLEESPELTGLRRHALKAFLSHDERGRELTLPTLEERAPHKAMQTFTTLDAMGTGAPSEPEESLS